MEYVRPLDPLPAATAQAIRAVAGLRDSQFGDLNFDLTLDYMRRRYVQPLARYAGIEKRVMADCAAGFGWLSFAFLLSGGSRAILIDADGPKLEATRQIAECLGLADRCDFVPEPFERLTLDSDSVDIFASVETLEHVGGDNIRACIEIMARAARQAVLVTTPNFIFPMVAHDTHLPFAHWLPAALRRPYAHAFGRAHRDRGNAFVKPWQLRPLRRKFRSVTRYQTFATANEFRELYPYYLPYGTDEQRRYRQKPAVGLTLLHRMLGAAFGSRAYALAPNLAAVWIRQ